MGFEPFDVVVVPFPFTDKVGTKRRPALVVSTTAFNGGHDQLVLAMITSTRRDDWPSDIPLEGWHDAGLAVPCKVRLKLFTLASDLIIKRAGSLVDHDRRAVRGALSLCLAVT